MKKIFIGIIAALSAVCLLCACGKKNKPVDNFAKLNEMAGASYSKIVITVSEEFAEQEITLVSKYEISYTADKATMVYEVERLNDISAHSPNESFKSKITGEATLKGGVVTGGEDVGITSSSFKVKYNFSGDYFENAVFSDGSFKADIKNVTAFAGSGATYSDADIVCKYSDKFSLIEITGDIGENDIKITYNFTT